tara:strand:+ start:170 stop:520 length:351 start_codon:yes stop_codon:yes gene_type:complete
MAYTYILAAALSSTAGNILLKISRENLTNESTFMEQYLNVYFIFAIIFYVFNVFLFSRALDVMQVNIGYPILAASGFTFLSIASWFFLNESMNVIQIVGIFTIVIGIFLLSSQTHH